MGTGNLSANNGGDVNGYLQCYTNFDVGAGSPYTINISPGQSSVAGEQEQILGPYSAVDLSNNSWTVDCVDGGVTQVIPTLDCVLSNDSASLGG